MATGGITHQDINPGMQEKFKGTALPESSPHPHLDSKKEGSQVKEEERARLQVWRPEVNSTISPHYLPTHSPTLSAEEYTHTIFPIFTITMTMVTHGKVVGEGLFQLHSPLGYPGEGRG